MKKSAPRDRSIMMHVEVFWHSVCFVLNLYLRIDSTNRTSEEKNSDGEESCRWFYLTSCKILYYIILCHIFFLKRKTDNDILLNPKAPKKTFPRCHYTNLFLLLTLLSYVAWSRHAMQLVFNNNDNPAVVANPPFLQSRQESQSLSCRYPISTIRHQLPQKKRRLMILNWLGRWSKILTTSFGSIHATFCILLFPLAFCWIWVGIRTPFL